MKKLLLTSDGFANSKIGKRFLELIGKNPKDIKVIFIPTASETEEEVSYVYKSEKELTDLDIPKENIFWLNMKNIPLAGEIQSYDVMYVCGGNTFHLLNEIRNTGFDKKIIEFINSDKIYVGVSAGSIIMGPSITTSSDKNKVGLKDINGFNFFSKAIVPHYQRKEKSIIDELEKKNQWKIIRLNDGQAVEVLGEISKIIE